MTSNLSCVTGNPASSAKIIMSGTLAPIVTFTACFDTITTINAKPIKLKGGIPLGGIYSGPGVNSLTGIYHTFTSGRRHTYHHLYLHKCRTLQRPRPHSHYQFSIFNFQLWKSDSLISAITRSIQTVQIGIQCWMASNLNYGTKIPSLNIKGTIALPKNIVIMIIRQLHKSWRTLPMGRTHAVRWHSCRSGILSSRMAYPNRKRLEYLFANYINNAFAGSPLKYSGYSGFNAFLSGARLWIKAGISRVLQLSSGRRHQQHTKAWAHGMNDVDPSVSVYPASVRMHSVYDVSRISWWIASALRASQWQSDGGQKEIASSLRSSQW